MEGDSSTPPAEGGVLRVGTVPFLVARPLDLGLGDEPGIELEEDVPARLVESLRAGRIDVALVSSIELFRQPGYRYLDGIGVAGHAGVSSVQVFLRKPLEEVRRLALDPASRAARTLVLVLLAERGLAPEIVEVELGEDPREADADAWLRIGDVALRETYEDGALPAFTPSAAWRELTGRPFVFASWIVRPGVEIERYAPAFAAARERGAAAAERLANEAAESWRLAPEHAREYLLEECLYEPAEAMRPSLFAFRDRAAAIGLCDGSFAPEAVSLEVARG